MEFSFSSLYKFVSAYLAGMTAIGACIYGGCTLYEQKKARELRIKLEKEKKEQEEARKQKLIEDDKLLKEHRKQEQTKLNQEQTNFKEQYEKLKPKLKSSIKPVYEEIKVRQEYSYLPAPTSFCLMNYVPGKEQKCSS